MTGLILKDFYLLKSFTRFLLTVFVVIGAVSLANGENIGSGMIIMMFTILVITTFSHDEYAKWDNFVLSTPIPVKKIVLSKYIFSAVVILTGAVLSLLIVVTINAFGGLSDLYEQLFVIYGMTLIGFVFISVMLPMLYKFGVEKGRIILFIVSFAPVIFLSFMKPGLSATAPDETTIMRIMLVAPIAVAGMVLLSFHISYKAYRKKEF